MLMGTFMSMDGKKRGEGKRAVAGVIVGAVAAAVACGPGAGGVRDRKGVPQVKATPGLEILVFPPDPASVRAPEGYAIIQDRREVDLTAGVTRFTTEGVPRRLIDSTVTLRSFSDPDGTKVRSQRFDYDARDTWAAIDRHIGGDIVVVTEGGTIRGKLVAYDAGAITVDTGATGGARYQVVPLAGASAIQLADHPGGWLTTPTIVWELEARRAGRQLLEILYETGGIHWWAHHVVTLRGEEAQVKSWATVDNSSGGRFDRAAVKLVEAEGRMTRSPYGGAGYGYGSAYYDEYGYDYGGSGYGFIGSGPAESVTYDEYGEAIYGGSAYGGAESRFHVYPVPGSVTIPDGEKTQLSLGSTTGKAWVEYRFEGVGKNTIVTGRVERNPQHGVVPQTSETSKALIVERPKGAPLPAGTVHIYRAAADGETPVLMADGEVTHVGAGEALRLSLGGSDEVTAVRARVRIRHDARKKSLREMFEITVENKTAAPARVSVIEHMYRGKKWEIRNESVTHQVVGPRTLSFPITVQPGKKSKVTYEVEYGW
jgi:hypothetical protein